MKKKLIIIPLFLALGSVWAQDDDLDLDMDAMWDNTVWNEIEDVADAGYEVEKVTAVAGVRGAEAEDEALHYLYYRRSMKGLSKLDLERALGKLILKKARRNSKIEADQNLLSLKNIEEVGTN